MEPNLSRHPTVTSSATSQPTSQILNFSDDNSIYPEDSVSQIGLHSRRPTFRGPAAGAGAGGENDYMTNEAQESWDQLQGELRGNGVRSQMARKSEGTLVEEDEGEGGYGKGDVDYDDEESFPSKLPSQNNTYHQSSRPSEYQHQQPLPDNLADTYSTRPPLSSPSPYNEYYDTPNSPPQGPAHAQSVIKSHHPLGSYDESDESEPIPPVLPYTNQSKPYSPPSVSPSQKSIDPSSLEKAIKSPPAQSLKSYIPLLPSDQDIEQNVPSGYPPSAQSQQRGFTREDLYSDRPPLWKRMIYDDSDLDKKIARYRRGIGVQTRAWCAWALGVGMVVAFIVEIARNWKYLGSPISTHPFNVMIGPSSEVLINVGARFTPCMKNTSVADIQFACLNETSTSTSINEATCSLEEICGFGGWGDGEPNQKFRFVLPVFLHAGVIHILLNLVAQLTTSADVEKKMGSLKFLILFMPSGIFGFILGGNFALIGQPSLGASGAIFGTNAALLVDLLAHWSLNVRPWRSFIFLLVEIIFGFALGLVPGIDNFAHLGGFAMGLLFSVLLYPVIHQTKRHRYIFWVLRAIALPLIIAGFVLLLKNFNTDDPAAGCSWCRYLSCWPTSSNNHCKGTGLQTETVTTTNKALVVIGLMSLGRRWLMYEMDKNGIEL